jgi:hypothetical protein
MSDMTLQMWKEALAKGQAIDLKVSSEALEPVLSNGDSVSIRKMPFATLTNNDVVLCELNGRVGLRRIVRERKLYGVRMLEVQDSGGRLVHLQETMVMGKAVTYRRRNGAIQSAIPASATPMASAMQILKKVLFPGT